MISGAARRQNDMAKATKKEVATAPVGGKEKKKKPFDNASDKIGKPRVLRIPRIRPSSSLRLVTRMPDA